jgi:hypothetical protein
MRDYMKDPEGEYMPEILSLQELLEQITNDINKMVVVDAGKDLKGLKDALRKVSQQVEAILAAIAK